MPEAHRIKVGQVGAAQNLVYLPAAWVRAASLAKGKEVLIAYDDDVAVLIPRRSEQGDRVLALLGVEPPVEPKGDAEGAPPQDSNPEPEPNEKRVSLDGLKRQFNITPPNPTPVEEGVGPRASQNAGDRETAGENGDSHGRY